MHQISLHLDQYCRRTPFTQKHTHTHKNVYWTRSSYTHSPLRIDAPPSGRVRRSTKINTKFQINRCVLNGEELVPILGVFDKRGQRGDIYGELWFNGPQELLDEYNDGVPIDRRFRIGMYSQYNYFPFCNVILLSDQPMFDLHSGLYVKAWYLQDDLVQYILPFEGRTLHHYTFDN